MDHLNVERALQYIRERNLFQDLCEVRAHSKAVKDFLTANNLDLSLAPRFEKELSRKGKAVDNFLAKKLRKQ